MVDGEEVREWCVGKVCEDRGRREEVWEREGEGWGEPEKWVGRRRVGVM